MQDVASKRKKGGSSTTTLCPLIVFDTMVALPQTTEIKRTSVPDGSTRSFIEAFAHLIDKAGLIAVGSKLPEAHDIGEDTDVARVHFPRQGLPALSYEGFLKALVSWSVTMRYGHEPTTSRLIHYLAAGSPRLLLRLSVEMDTLCVTWGDYLDKLTWPYFTCMYFNSRTDLPGASEKALTMWAVAALASGTRTRVVLEDRMPLLEGCIWEDAAKGHLASQRDDEPAHKQTNSSPARPDDVTISGVAKVAEEKGANVRLSMRMPPLFTLFDDVYDTFAWLRDGCMPSGGAASFLQRTWPRGLDLSFLHVAMKKSELFELSFGDLGSTRGGVPYEKLVATALIGRWYLLYLMAASPTGEAITVKHHRDPKNRRVALERVLGIEGDARLNGVMVDFSSGLILMKTDDTADQQCLQQEDSLLETAVYHGGAGSGRRHRHYGMQFCAFKGKKKMTICVQCRYGARTNWSTIQKQCYTNSGSLVDILLVVNQRARGDESGGGTLSAAELERCVFVDSSVFCDDGALLAHLRK